jgi:predicted nucleic acid-binding OB-fold protein
MAYTQRTGIPVATQSILTDDPDFLRFIVERVIQEVLDAENSWQIFAKSSRPRRGNRQ